MASLIEGYLDELESQLDFDRRLARRVRDEFADHLAEAVEAQCNLAPDIAEREALARIGTARAIAAVFTLDALSRQTERIWLVILTTLLATFLAMRLRTLGLADGSAGPIAPLVDRYAFVGALVIGCGGWFALRRRTAAPVLDAVTTKGFRMVALVAAATLAALSLSTAAGLARIAASGGDFGLLPSLVAAGNLVEFGLMIWLTAQILALRRRTVRARAILAG
ncbi:MAG: HAAS signaling domain-containing protein [Phreatobacter sp.]